MMTASELVEELERLYSESQDPEGYLTTTELADLLGIGVKGVRSRLRAAQRQGRLEVTHVRRAALNGQGYLCPAYRLTTTV